MLSPATRLVGAPTTPWAMNRTQTIRKATSTFIPGPARITTIRFHTGWRKYARGATSADSSSRGFMPVIFT